MRLLTFVLIFLSLFAGRAQAQTAVGPVTISSVRAGWVADQFAIVTTQPISNPAKCPVADGYISAISEPGYKTYYALALMAFSTGKNVTLIISNTECTASRPRIIGINVEK